MSELTPCNYCTLQRIKRDAKKSGKKVSIRNETLLHWTQGRAVYVHPNTVKGNARFDKKYFQAHFAELTDHCVC